MLQVLSGVVRRSCAVALGAGMMAGAAFGEPPPNDGCADAIEVFEGAVTGATAQATNDGTGTCGQSATAPDVWYVYTPPQDGFLSVSACPSAYNTVLGLWDGCPGEGVEVACNDNCCILQSLVSLIVEGGQPYYIRVSGWNGSTGAFQLDIDLTTEYVTGPDVIYSGVTTITHWQPPVDAIHAYSLSSFTCNVGDLPLQWGDVTPLLAMNAYRLAGGRLEQIGMSWVKNGTSAVAQNFCMMSCAGEDGCILGPGCRDAYTSSFNGIQAILGPRSQVNAFTGAYPGPTLDEGNSIFKRLQIPAPDLSTAGGALHFVEGHYVSWDDAAAGNALNNASYRRVTVNGNLDLAPTGDHEVGTPAIYAWRDHGGGPGIPDPSVEVVAVDVPGEGRFHVAAKVTDLGGGVWRYDYAVHNLNSHRSAGSFSIPLPKTATPGAIGFHDVDYHSGEPYDGGNWTVLLGSESLRWSSPQSYSQNPDTNALRWGTMYNFWIETDVPPSPGEVTVWLFRPGDPQSASASVLVPGGATSCPGDLNRDDTVDVQDLVDLITSWGPCASCPADIDGDGEVDVPDLVILITNWGDC